MCNKVGRRQDYGRTVSVCICTHDRADSLREALSSLVTSLAAYDGRVEILIVDNSSKNLSSAVVEEFSIRHPELSLVLIDEPHLGLARARNAALKTATGEVICFLDDDVVVMDGWLTEIVRAFDVGENVGCVAGQAILSWPDSGLPSWITPRYNGFFGVCYFGRRSKTLNENEFPVGCNFAFSREAVSAVGLFDAELGRRGAALLSGEDDDYAGRVRECGYSIAYAPDASVIHKVSPERTTYRWLLRRYFWQGVTTSCRAKNRAFLYPLRWLPKLVSNCAVLPLVLLFGGKSRFFHTCFRIANSLGPFYGWFLLRRSRLGSSQTRTLLLRPDKNAAD